MGGGNSSRVWPAVLPSTKIAGKGSASRMRRSGALARRVPEAGARLVRGWRAAAAGTAQTRVPVFSTLALNFGGPPGVPLSLIANGRLFLPWHVTLHYRFHTTAVASSNKARGRLVAVVTQRRQYEKNSRISLWHSHKFPPCLSLTEVLPVLNQETRT